MVYKYIISIDPGLKGAIVIFPNNKSPLIYSIPLKQIIKSNKKKKNIYNLGEIVNILGEYQGKKVLFVIERQSSRRGEGVTSSFTTGQGYGSLLGIAYALKFDVTIVSPVTWKKYFPQLQTKNSEKNKKEQKELREKVKNIKDNDLKKSYEREIDKLGREIKKEGKNQGRAIAQKLYPKLKKEFVKVSDDGKSDAIMLGVFMKNQIEIGAIV